MYHVGDPSAASQPGARTPPGEPATAHAVDAGPGSQAPYIANPHARETPPAIAVVWNRKWLIGMVALAGAAAAMLIGSLFAPRYGAQAQLLINPSEPRVVDRSLRTSSQFNEALTGEVETQKAVLMSGRVLKKTVDKLDLGNDPEFTGGMLLGPADYLRDALKKAGLKKPDPKALPADPAISALRTLSDRAWASRVPRTFIVEVGVWSTDPAKSVRIVDTMVEAFLEEQQQSRAGAARQASNSLGGRLDGLRRKVASAEKAVDDFKKKNAILSASGQLIDEQQLTAVSTQLIEARSRRAQAEANYRQIQQIRRSGGDIGSIPEATASQTLAALRGQLATARRRESELAAQLLPRHPVVRQARQEVRRLEAEVNAETGRIADALRVNVERARNSERSLTTTLEGLKKRLTDLKTKQVQLRELQRDLEANRSVYEAFLLRTQEIGEQEKIKVPRTRIVSDTLALENRIFPPSKAVLGLAGLVLGAGLGAALAIALHFLAPAPAATAAVAPARVQPARETTADAADLNTAQPMVSTRNVTGHPGQAEPRQASPALGRRSDDAPSSDNHPGDHRWGDVGASNEVAAASRHDDGSGRTVSTAASAANAAMRVEAARATPRAQDTLLSAPPRPRLQEPARPDESLKPRPTASNDSAKSPSANGTASANGQSSEGAGRQQAHDSQSVVSTRKPKLATASRLGAASVTPMNKSPASDQPKPAPDEPARSADGDPPQPAWL